jgi:hypothetical protein
LLETTADLQPGDLLLGRDEQTACVQSVTATTRTATVYNLRVAADHTFFVGSHAWGFSLWVHNTYKIQPSKIGEPPWHGFSVVTRCRRT